MCRVTLSEMYPAANGFTENRPGVTPRVKSYRNTRHDRSIKVDAENAAERQERFWQRPRHA